MKNQIIQDLLAGKIVAIPTETVEGYAVALGSEKAVRDLMRLKERGFDSGKVFTLVPESREAISKYAMVPGSAKRLIETFVPGELTLILKKNPEFSHFYYDHFEAIGVRIPDYPLFAEILPETGPLILTSANPRGGTPKSVTGHRPSTIIDFTAKSPRIIRQGDLVIDVARL